MSSSDLPILRPIPRRPFDLDTPPPPSTSRSDSEPPIEPIKRTKSTIALTSSTLFGIYSYPDQDAPATTPSISRNPSILDIADFDFHRSNSARFLPSAAVVARKRRPTMPSGAAPMNKVPNARAALALGAMRVAALFVFGVAYGVIVTHMHHSQRFTAAAAAAAAATGPVVAAGGRYSVGYYAQWGLAGVALGSLLPWLDGDGVAGAAAAGGGAGGRVAWDPAVRSIGAFVGIAYAIRKLPWQSTLQVSLTLALVNPFLWYIVDRTRAGFWFSAAVGVAGTTAAVLLQQTGGPHAEPATATATGSLGGGSVWVPGWMSVENVGVWTWVCSVLFCSCVCFGNVGRRLAWLERRE